LVNYVNHIALYYQKIYNFLVITNLFETLQMSKKSDLTIGERRGFPIYKANPSLVGLERGTVRAKPANIIQGNRAMVVNDRTGEVTGEGSVAFIESEEVDSERFVKIFLGGLDGMFKLTKSGQTVFKLLWLQVQNKKEADRIELNHYIAEDYGMEVTYRMMNRGIKELIEKDFLYHTPTAGIYFYNTRFMFNGNRIVTAKQYVLQDSEIQQNLPLDEPKDETE